MRHASVRLVLLGAALVAAPAAAHAQARPEAAIRNAAEVEAWFGELQDLHDKLEDIQTRALADAQISAAQTELGARIKLAMERVDPTLQKSLSRMEAMEAEVSSAGQRRDAAKLQQLSDEAEQIQRQFLSAQQRALQQPEIAALVAGFQQKLERKMLELSPRSERLVARFRELEAKLASQAQPAAPSR
ncbi:MAG: hypothetical protein KY464_08255 [Gemmatimonadetes bacterium]|nr:hypothetical protein [Gemmatimonadota bacterium]